jgi:small subunit ribosomal protein S20
MANTKSQEKRNRQNVVRAAKNQALKSKVKTLSKNLKASVESKKIEDAQKNLIDYVKVLDKAVKVKTIHKNYAANKKSKAAKLINSIKK